MDLLLTEYLETNEEYLETLLETYSVKDLTEYIYNEIITINYYVNLSEGHSTPDGAKILKKFVVSEFKDFYNRVRDEVEDMYEVCFNSEDLYERKKEQLKNLLTLETYEQRTPGWYSARKKILTASDMANALSKGHFSTRDELIAAKIAPPEFKGNEATEWGVKYEDVAIAVYEKRNDIKVLEFGLVQHPTLDIFGASPDGIVDDNETLMTARMVEIKCPWKRKIVHGEVPWHYWAQMQGQLDTCDLDECDFLQVKIMEYKNSEEYLADTLIEDGQPVHGYNKSKKEKSIVVATQGYNKLKYHYCPIGLDPIKEAEWIQNIEDRVNITYWHIDLYSCFLVKRDKPWFQAMIPEIYRFAEDLAFWREKGIVEYKNHLALKKKNKPCRTKKEKQNKELQECMLSDED